MKRKITILFVLLSLVLTLAVSASAAAPHTLTPSEDLQTVVLDDETYVRANTSYLSPYYVEATAQVQLTEEQQTRYEQVMLYFNEEHPAAIRVDYYEVDGMTVQVSYIREDLYEPYMELLEQETVTVSFRYPYDNDAITEKSLLCGEATVLYLDQLRKAMEFEVYAVGQESLTIRKGWLLVFDDEYYYVDRIENDLLKDDELHNLPRVDGWKVTDPDLCARFDKALDLYYGEGFGVLEDPEISDKVTGVFMILLFGFLPLLVLVLFAVFAFLTKKKTYRTLYILICAWALLVLAALITTVIVA